VNNYKELKIWQKSIELAVAIYKITQGFPKSELFGLTVQMRRSASSIASNIAEGAGRNSKKDFSNFLGVANGSTCELATQLMIAGRVNLINYSDLKSLQSQITEIQKMNWALKRALLKAKSTNDQY
jgi:four helix bundle protein